MIFTRGLLNKSVIAFLLTAFAGCAAEAAPRPPVATVAAASEVARVTEDKQEKETPSSSSEVFSAKRRVELKVDSERRGKRGLELWYSFDKGQNWINQGSVAEAKETVAFMAPGDGRYGFILVPVGVDGKRESTPKPGDAPEQNVVVDTLAPVVEVLTPNGGEVFGSNRSTVIQWLAADANMAPSGIRIDISTGGDDRWITIAKDLPNSGKYHWDIGPASSPQFRVRVLAKDLAGNIGMDISDKDFTIDGLAPDLKLTGPTLANEIPVKLEWRGGDLGGSGLKRVTLYVTRDNGQGWQKYGDDDDLQSPTLFQDLDGVYGFKLVAEDKVGNANPPPAPGMAPDLILVLDRTKPEVKLLSPQGGGFLGGEPVDIQWSARDNIEMPENGISLFYSPDAGRTWKEIARNVKNDGLYKWTPPKMAGADYRVKITASDIAGNVREVVSDRFGMDDKLPQAFATGPDRSRSSTVQINYEIKDLGSSPLKSVSLYYRPENVGQWIKYGDDADAKSPFAFSKADGKYGITVVCDTEAGLRSGRGSKAPDKDTEPQLDLVIDSTGPQLSLETFNEGGYVMSGCVKKVLWKMIEAHPDPKGMTIYHTPDGGINWNVVATGIDPSRGEYSWDIPKSSGSRHKLRLSCTDAFGNSSKVESAVPFTIDDDLPDVTILQKPADLLRSNRMSLRYKAQDPTSGIERVLLYGKPQGGKDPYKLLSQTHQAEGTIECDVPGEGLWDFVVVAVDTAGQASAAVEKGPKPDFSVGFDLTKPTVKLKEFQTPRGARLPLNDEWELIWHAEDNATPSEKLQIRIEYSSDGGQSWFVAQGRSPNAGKVDMRPFLLPGKKHRVRIVAVDEAGNEGEDFSDDFDPGDLPPLTTPEARALGPDQSRATNVEINYEIKERGNSPLKSVTLYYRPESAPAWLKYGDDADLQSPFLFTRTDGRYGIYIACATTMGLKSGRVQKTPENDTPPQLELTIDSTSPHLELQTFDDGGAVLSGCVKKILWKIHEAHPDPKGLTIYHSTDGGSTWNEVAKGLDPFRGEYAWDVPKAGGTKHKLRLIAMDIFGNTGKVESARVFTIDDDLPTVTVVEKPAELTRFTHMSARYKAADATSGIGRVLLYGKSLSDNSAYKLLGEKRISEGGVEWDVTGGGAWGFFFIAVDGVDRSSADIEDNPKPDFTVNVDLEKPGVKFGEFPGQNGAVLPINLEGELFWNADDNLSPAEKIAVRIEYSTDAGKTWFVAAPKAANTGKAEMRSHLPAGRKCRVRIVATDEAGNEGQAVSGDFDPADLKPIDAEAPRLTLESFNEGGSFKPGVPGKIVWKMVEAHPDPKGLAIEHSADGGVTWNVIAKDEDPTRGEYAWELPKSAGTRHKLRLTAVDTYGNTGRVESARAFTIDDDPPTVAILDKPAGPLRSGRIAVKYKAQDATSGVDRVLLYGKPMRENGRYEMRAEARQAEGTLECDVQGDGTWGFLAVAVDAAGHVSADIDKNPAPDVTVMIDGTKPSVRLEKFRTPRGTEICLSNDWEVLWKAEDAVSPSDKLSIKIEFSSDAGKTWYVAAARTANAGKFDMRGYVFPGKKYRVRIAAADEAGNEGEDFSDDFDPDDLPLPTLALSGVEGGKLYEPGAVIPIAWSSSDPRLKEATLEMSRDGAKTWQSLGPLSAEPYKFTMPEAGACALRGVARDAGNRDVQGNPVTFEVIPGPESVKMVVTAPQVEVSKPLVLRVEPWKAVNSREAYTELSSDGRTWNRHSDVTGPEFSVPTPATPGDYWIRAVVKAADGRIHASKPVSFKVFLPKEIITTPHPTPTPVPTPTPTPTPTPAPVPVAGGSLRLENFLGGDRDVFCGGRARVIALKTNLPLGEIHVAFSENSGRAWTEVPKDQLTPVSGGLHWNALPVICSQTLRLRVWYRDASGAEVSDQSRKDFSIDSKGPTARVRAPLKDSPVPVTLQTEMRPSIAPIKELVLYSSPDNGETWVQHNAYPAVSTLLFRPTVSGDYGLYLVARSTVGLAGEPPQPGTPPQAVVKVRVKDAKPPEVAKVAFTKTMPEAVRGGVTVDLSWTPAKAQAFLVVDGKKESIAAELPASGVLPWTVPSVDSKDCQIIVELEGKMGDPSSKFEIDSTPPAVEGATVELPEKGK